MLAGKRQKREDSPVCDSPTFARVVMPEKEGARAGTLELPRRSPVERENGRLFAIDQKFSNQLGPFFRRLSQRG